MSERTALYIDPTTLNVGIGTSQPTKILHIQGDVMLTGQIYNSNGTPYTLSGTSGGTIVDGSTAAVVLPYWKSLTSNQPTITLTTGSFTQLSNVTMQRYSANDMILSVYIQGTVDTKPSSLSDDYRLSIPVVLNNSSYPTPTIVGDLWLTANSNNAQTTYKAIAKTIPGTSNYVTLKYLSGTTEVSFADISAGQTISLDGTLTYQTANFLQVSADEVITIPGTNIQWFDAQVEYPAIYAPPGGIITQTYRKGMHRYLGDDLIYNITADADVVVKPSDQNANYIVSLQYPISIETYGSNVIVGDLWLTVTTNNRKTTYKAYARTIHQDSSNLDLRFLNGTYDLSLADIDAGSSFRIQGNITYKTTQIAATVIPKVYLPNRLYQDQWGNVAINNNSAPIRSRFEIIETSNLPALIVDQRSGSDLAQFRSNATDIKMIINAKGNVGIGTSIAPQAISVKGNMLFDGIMYDPTGNPLWIPGSSVNWQNTPYLPAISVSGGVWTQNNTATKGLWRFIGNEINYNVNVHGSLDTPPSSTTTDFRISLPTPIKLTSYSSNAIIGDLWADVYYQNASNTYPVYAKPDMQNDTVAILRVLSGTKDESFSTMLAGSALNLRGTITYNSLSSLIAAPVPSTYLPANFRQDQSGNVTLNTNNAARGRFDIVTGGSTPALVVDQSGSGNIAEFVDTGVRKVVIDTNGNVGIGTTQPRASLHVTGDTVITTSSFMYRNRLINGDMRLDQTNTGNATNNTGSLTEPTFGFGLDRFRIANNFDAGGIVQKQVELTPADTNATEGFKYALSLTSVSQSNLMIHIPFDGGSIADVLGTLTSPSGVNVAFSTSTVKIGSHSLDLTANTAGSAPTSYISYTVLPKISLPLTFALWIYIPTSIAAATQVIGGFGNPSRAISCQFWMNTSGQVAAEVAIYGTIYRSPQSATTALVANTWYHLCMTVQPGGNLILYFNASSVASIAIPNITTLTNENLAQTDSTSASTLFTLGRKPTTSSIESTKCYMDDVRVYNRALVPAEVALLAGMTSMASLSTLAPPASPTVYFPFNGNLTDSSGNNNTLTQVGTAYYATGYVFPQAVYLQNEAQVVTSTIAQNYLTSTYNCPTTFTVSFWCCYTRGNSTGGTLFVTNRNQTNLTNAINIYIQNSGLWAAFHNTANIGSSFALLPGTWCFATLTYNSGSLNFYVNGNKIGNTLSYTYAVDGFTLGNAFTGGATYYTFAGYISEFRIYNSVLTPFQIAQMYYSYTPYEYTLLQQLVDGYMFADFGWGTPYAQPATVSCWIKNNTATAQSFALSVANEGMIAYIPFDTDYNDLVGTILTQPVRYGVTTISTSTYKVGTGSIYFGNTTGSTPSQYVAYTVPANITPYTVAFWVNMPTISGSSGTQTVFSFSSTLTSTNEGFSLSIGNNTTIESKLILSSSASVIYQINHSMTISANTWYHLAVTYYPNNYLTLYVNGVLASTNQIGPATKTPINGGNLVVYSGGQSINHLAIGAGRAGNNYAFTGNIDDFRIYNRPLTAVQIAQLYANNSGTTAVTNYLIPRSWVYNSPVIPANSWNKVVFTISPDTAGYWPTDNSKGLVVSLCLGASSNISTNALATWNTPDYFTGSNVQLYHATNNFMSTNANNIYVTGFQLEKGGIVSSFEFLAYNNEINKILLNGSSPLNAAPSAKYIQDTFNITKDGVYWINLPIVGPTQVYCIMDRKCAGGGWMMAMKGSRSTTFGYNANYWTTYNTLNPLETNISDGDAKFDVFNYYPATDWLAIFPDVGSINGIYGGDIAGGYGRGWIWVENNAVNNTISLCDFYNRNYQVTKLSNGIIYGVTNPKPFDSLNPKWNQSIWSSQAGFQWYGINYRGNANHYVRWGWGANNENDQASNDSSGGIGMIPNGISAGDYYSAAGTVGLNRSMRFEWYVR